MSDSDGLITLNRRELLKITTLGAAVSAVECNSLVPKPHARRQSAPERIVKTVCGGCGAGCGISVRTVAGNAVGIEGLAEHPLNHGTLCARGVAEIQNLYHPARFTQPQLRTPGRSTSALTPTTWPALWGAVTANSGPVVIGVGDVSFAERHLLELIANRLGATLVDVEPPAGGMPRQGLRQVLGSDNYTFDIGNADYVLSLGSDWLVSWPSFVEAQQSFAAMRRRSSRGRMVTVDARLSNTAAKSDAWIPVADPTLYGLALARAIFTARPATKARLPALATMVDDARFESKAAATALGITAAQITDVAEGLLSAANAVVLGERGPAENIAVALNVIIGAVGRKGGLLAAKTVALPGGSTESVKRAAAFPSEAVHALVILYRANPLFVTAATSGWQKGIAGARSVISLSDIADESTAASDAVIALASPLETTRLQFGASASGQLIASAGPAAVAKLADTLAPVDALVTLATALGVTLPWKSGDDYLTALATTLGAQDQLADGGFVEVKGSSPVQVTPRMPALATASAPPSDFPLALRLFSSPAFFGGLGAHLPVLHKIAEVPLTLPVELSATTATALGLQNGNDVWVESAQGRVRAKVVLRKGIRPDSCGMGLGLGRQAEASLVQGLGFNPLTLISNAPTFVRIRRA